MTSSQAKDPKAKSTSDHDLTLIYRDGGEDLKKTLVIAKKVAPLAVDRNRIRRLFAEAARGKNLTGEMVVVVKRNIAHLKSGQLKARLDKLLIKLK